MDPIASSRSLFPAEHQAPADSSPPWLTDRLDELVQEMELLNIRITPAPVSDSPLLTQNTQSPPNFPDLYCGDTAPSYYMPKFGKFPKSE